MLAYRLVKRRYASDPLDPAGARRYGGRWNSKGIDALYAADSIALAILEILVHLRDDTLLAHYLLCRLDIPDEAIMRLADDELPSDWRQNPPPASTQRIGDQWLEQHLAVALLVPSTVVPQQYNLLIDPGHPDFTAIAADAACEPFPLDPRLGC